jgi:endoglucanase
MSLLADIKRRRIFFMKTKKMVYVYWEGEGSDNNLQVKMRKSIAIIALAVIIGFSMAACGGGTTNYPIYPPAPPGGTTPTVTSVTISPGTAPVAKGATQAFTVTVTGTNNPAQTVTWSIETAGVNADTTITSAGLLTVSSAETKTSLTVKATSTVDIAKNGTATVTVTGGGDIRPQTPESMSNKTALQYFTDNNIKAGWNLGNTLDAVSIPSAAAETAWGNPAATQALFNGVKESGFDIVRIPVTWIGHIGASPDYTVSEARLKRVAEVIGYAKTAGIKMVIINIHHDGNYTEPAKGTWGFVDFKGAVSNSAKKTQVQEEIGKVWTQIANYFKNYGDYLIFETLNEVHSGNWGFGASNAEQDILFDWNQAALSAIRATGGNNATRYVAVPGLGSTEPSIVISANNRNKLLPNDGANGKNKLIVAVHYYDPSQYTVAGITDPQPLIHTWGTSAEKEELAHNAGSLKTTFIDNGIAVYFGEWGAPTDTRSSMNATVKATHLDYIGSVAEAARKNGIVPIYWDDNGSFKILERSNGKPKTGLWADSLSTMMTKIANTTPLPPGGGETPPTDVGGNLGNWDYGYMENGVDRNYQQACWTLSGGKLAQFKSAATLTLVFNTTPAATMQLVWQDTSTWSWNSTDILSASGTAQNGASWNAGTKTLTITLATALANYANIASHNEIKLVIAYYGGSNISALGITSANLQP